MRGIPWGRERGGCRPPGPYMYIYIYAYTYVCVCVCTIVCFLFRKMENGILRC